MTIGNWERGVFEPSLKDVQRLAIILCCDVNDLYGDFDADFKDVASDSIRAMFYRCADSKDVKEMRVALDIFKHLFPEPSKIDISIEPSDAQQSDDDLLDEGDEPQCQT